MSQALNNLLTLLNLEKIEEGLFRGQSEDLGLRQVFGGQVVGQAQRKKRYQKNAWFTRFIAIFYALVIASDRLFMTWKFCATATASAPAALPLFRTESLFFI